ncbi:DUF1415 domain-containing protein [Thiomicrospira pelophila]|uniref:DUF1415 domain-containing protein n=1 Tax=Thiomicrospira pelophila TaxID=934 RepID=UPI0004A75870|nr:DUF1415 domain-containing protein [Thiomicrospira pelophila]
MSDSTTDLQIIQATRCWVDKVVVGLNFCPFAKREVDAERVYYSVQEDSSLEAVLTQLMLECQRLDQNPDIETSLLILPVGFEGFLDYLDLIALAEDLMVQEGYEGVYQLASFHPDYCFAGEAENDPANYTNRSPYPMLHLIREASLEKALAHHPDPDSIPQTNIDLAREKGLEQMQALRQACLGG